jgi:hypothetical protein
VPGAADGEFLTCSSDEKAFVRSCEFASERLPFKQIILHFSSKRTVEWHPPRSAFEHPYKQHTGLNINVTISKLQSLAEADAGAIENQQEHSE